MGVFGWRPEDPYPPQKQSNQTDTEQEKTKNDEDNRKNNQSPSADEEPMHPSKEGWDPINKKGD